jgi:hypothetical protein
VGALCGSAAGVRDGVLFDRRLSVQVDALRLDGFDVDFTIKVAVPPTPNTVSCAYGTRTPTTRRLQDSSGSMSASKWVTRPGTVVVPRGLRDVVSTRDGADWSPR